ncbi:MAG: hypothetical protein R2749_03385 [Acidimicrobiales bacterium]
MAAGTDDGFDGFYRETYSRIAAALAYTLGDGDLATEAADEAMARAFARWGSVSTMANPAGWAYQVGLNWSVRCCAGCGADRHRSQLATRSEPTLEGVVDVDLGAALLRLELGLRAVVVCRHLCDWSVAQTAEASILRPGTVKKAACTGRWACSPSALDGHHDGHHDDAGPGRGERVESQAQARRGAQRAGDVEDGER